MKIPMYWNFKHIITSHILDLGCIRFLVCHNFRYIGFSNETEFLPHQNYDISEFPKYLNF